MVATFAPAPPVARSDADDGPARAPHLRLLQGGRGAAPVPPSIYWCRRLAALVLAVTCVVAVAVGAHAGLSALVASPGGHGPSASGVTRAAGAPTHVVGPGETLWTVAADLAGDGDVRPVVDELARLNGGPAVDVGQVLVLPGGPVGSDR